MKMMIFAFLKSIFRGLPLCCGENGCHPPESHWSELPESANRSKKCAKLMKLCPIHFNCLHARNGSVPRREAQILKQIWPNPMSFAHFFHLFADFALAVAGSGNTEKKIAKFIKLGPICFKIWASSAGNEFWAKWIGPNFMSFAPFFDLFADSGSSDQCASAGWQPFSPQRNGKPRKIDFDAKNRDFHLNGREP